MSRDTREFTQLLSPHYNDALRYSRALCARWSPDEAEDVLQQAFLQALENFDSLKDTSKFKSWFFKIITREFYTSIRKHFWKKFLPLDNSTGIPEMPDVFSRADANEDTEILYSALSKLSAKERSAILLFEIADFSIEEITEIQGENSQSAVKSRLSRVRKKLNKYLTEPAKLSRVQTNKIFKGDLEYETIKLIAELRTEK
ncbi:MAG TPA: RNA polymerase sigma factor [Ignavibacteria bacterium]|nr:RNA polymerase sigma factor [Ignavibacteria bacterium]